MLLYELRIKIFEAAELPVRRAEEISDQLAEVIENIDFEQIIKNRLPAESRSRLRFEIDY